MENENNNEIETEQSDEFNEIQSIRRIMDDLVQRLEALESRIDQTLERVNHTIRIVSDSY